MFELCVKSEYTVFSVVHYWVMFAKLLLRVCTLSLNQDKHYNKKHFESFRLLRILHSKKYIKIFNFNLL